MNTPAESDPGGQTSRIGPAPGTGPADAIQGREAENDRLAGLMARAARGHEDAFAELYDRTSARIYGVILRVLRSADHSAEVTQEVYVEVWRQSARFDSSKGSVMAWMTTMAHRRAVDRVRSVTSEVARDEQYALRSRTARSTRCGTAWNRGWTWNEYARGWPH